MAVVKKFLAGAAVLALGWSLSAAVAEAAIVNKGIEAKILGLPPIACTPSQHKFVVDGGDIALMCGGKATMEGPGWRNYVWPGAVNNQYYYVTGYGENGTEKIKVYPSIVAAGLYEVWVSYRGSENRTEAAAFYVYADAGTTYKVTVNQKEPHAGALFSAKLGTFFFNAHTIDEAPRTGGYVTCESESLRASESVDAVFFKYIKPVPPTNVLATDGTSASRINIRWKAAPGAKFYQVYRNTVNEPSTAQLIAPKIGPLTLLYQDMGLDEGKTYYYWVRTGGYLSRLSSFSLSNQGSTGVSPAKVTGLMAGAGGNAGEVNLQWSAAANATSYEVFRGATSVAAEATLIATQAALTFGDSGLTPGNTYYYFVRGKNAIATGAYSDPAAAVAP